MDGGPVSTCHHPVYLLTSNETSQINEWIVRKEESKHFSLKEMLWRINFMPVHFIVVGWLSPVKIVTSELLEPVQGNHIEVARW